MIKDTGRWIVHIFAACFHFADCRLKKFKKNSKLHYQDKE